MEETNEPALCNLTARENVERLLLLDKNRQGTINKKEADDLFKLQVKWYGRDKEFKEKLHALLKDYNAEITVGGFHGDPKIEVLFNGVCCIDLGFST